MIEEKKQANDKEEESKNKTVEVAVEDKNKEEQNQEKPIQEEKKYESQKEPKKDFSSEKKEKKQKAVQLTEKKTEAFTRGTSLPISKKHSMYLGDFIKNKKIDDAIVDLEKVTKYKKIVPFKGEIPHRKGKGMMSGRYPIKASQFFIKMLKGLRGNALVNGLDLEKTRIVFSSANWAHRPPRREGRKAKRTHVLIKASEVEQ